MVENEHTRLRCLELADVPGSDHLTILNWARRYHDWVIHGRGPALRPVQPSPQPVDDARSATGGSVESDAGFSRQANNR